MHVYCDCCSYSEKPHLTTRDLIVIRKWHDSIGSRLDPEWPSRSPTGAPGKIYMHAKAARWQSTCCPYSQHSCGERAQCRMRAVPASESSTKCCSFARKLGRFPAKATLCSCASGRPGRTCVSWSFPGFTEHRGSFFSTSTKTVIVVCERHEGSLFLRLNFL